MKALAITSKGLEPIASLEIKEILGIQKSDILDSCVTFEIKEEIELCKFCYKSQSITRAILLIDSFEFDSADDFFSKMKDVVSKVGFDKWLSGDQTFRVGCMKVDNDFTSSDEINSEVGGFILDKVRNKVDLNNPTVTFFVFVSGNNAFFGIDFSGIDLSKRDYKFFAHASSIKGTIAYGLLRIAGYSLSDMLVDPFSGAGVIPIEAALFVSSRSVNYFRKDKLAFTKLKLFDSSYPDKLFLEWDNVGKPNARIYCLDSQFRNIDSAKKNAKIASVEKLINFSRKEVEWVDLKFGEKNVDKIVTNPLAASKRVNEKIVKKLYDEFFYQIEFILKDDGKIITLARSPELLKEYASKHKFKVSSETSIWIGKEEVQVLIFCK